MLESKAIIRSEPNGSFTVAEFASTLNDAFDLLLGVDQTDIGELLEVRHMLEAKAATLAASRRHQSDVDRMTDEIEAMETASNPSMSSSRPTCGFTSRSHRQARTA